uniref:G_PROTEIN_RECEP_F1_2 domain-containing protein n=1 Tax=Strongyloides papillosus TaxID=174720 RepID=A0A0N5BNE4_STREA
MTFQTDVTLFTSSLNNHTSPLQKNLIKINEKGSLLTVMDLDKKELYQHTFFDFAEIFFLLTIVFIGTYMNIKGHLHHYHIRQLSSARGKINGRVNNHFHGGSFKIFIIHLSITDFFIMYAHGVIEAIWIYTKSWEFGNISCKFFKYFSTFSYYANAYMVTMIGMDRLISVYAKYNEKSTLRKYLMSASAWMVGGILAMPQIFIWQTYEPYKCYTQCVTIFAIAEHENLTEIDGYKIDKLKYIYELYHQIFVSWFPFIILLTTYILILVKIMKLSFETLQRLLPQFISKNKCVWNFSNRDRQSKKEETLSNAPSISEFELVPDFKFNTKKNYKMNLKDKKTDSIKESSIIDEIEEVVPFIDVNKKTKEKCITNLNKHRKKGDETMSDHYKDFSSSSFEIPRLSHASIRNTVASEISSTGSVILTSPNGIRRYYIPFWRRKWHFKIFTTAVLIVCVHFLIWLPYSTISVIRFIDEELYNYLSPTIGRFCETLILINSIINPMLYQLNK